MWRLASILFGQPISPVQSAMLSILYISFYVWSSTVRSLLECYITGCFKAVKEDSTAVLIPSPSSFSSYVGSRERCGALKPLFAATLDSERISSGMCIFRHRLTDAATFLLFLYPSLSLTKTFSRLSLNAYSRLHSICNNPDFNLHKALVAVLCNISHIRMLTPLP